MRTTTITIATQEIRLQALPPTEALPMLGDMEDLVREVERAKVSATLPRITPAMMGVLKALAARAQVKVPVEEKDQTRHVWQPLDLDNLTVTELIAFGVQGVIHTMGTFQR